MVSENGRLAEAVADELFGAERAGQPVYMLGDARALSRIAKTAGLNGDPCEEVTRVVRRTLWLDDPGVAPFRWQAESAARHSLHPLETPPALPLLLVLTLAAEQMQADGDVAAHNYYSRLHRLLRVPTDRYGRVEEDYRRHASELWGSLNGWLEAWEGQRGIPTAYAIGSHEYIGLPMSQAVVRQHDRAGLHELFALEGLAAGTRMSPSDMGNSLAPYASVTPSPLSSHLLRLWEKPSARDRIVDAACLELESWDGVGGTGGVVGLQALTPRLLAFVRTFPGRSVRFNLMLPVRTSESGLVSFETSDGEVSVPTAFGPGGSTRLSPSETVDAASLVGDRLQGHVGEDAHQTFSRQPRRVVPMRWDEMQGAFVEVERVALGEDSLVLVREGAQSRVEKHLEMHARPGWRAASNLNGVPAGWSIYENVQIVSAPSDTTHLDLIPLAPRARTSLTLRGGFALPGLLRKWSVLAPPEVIALASGASSVTVRVYASTRLDAKLVVHEFTEVGELCIASMSRARLIDGEFTVAMFVDGAVRPSSTALLRLRSADTPQFSVEAADLQLVYSPDSAATWPLSAGPAEWPVYVNGARTAGLDARDDAPSTSMREFQPRERSRVDSSTRVVRVGRAAPEGSCMTTGMHRFHFPTVRPNQPRQRTVDGECTECGLVKRQPGTAWGARRREAKAAPAGHVVDIPPVVESGDPDFQIAFDALNHVGQGTFSTFERIAAQVEGSGLFADSFLRRQEIAGHIDVRRDEWLQVTEWAVNAATLVEVAPGRWVLIGARSRGLVERLRDLLDGVAEVRETVDAALAMVEVVGELGAPGVLAEIGIDVVDRATPMRIVQSLPALSAVATGLKRTAVPRFRSAERWDTASASWRRCDSLSEAGAYRLKEFRSLYVLRSDADIADGTIAVGNAQLVKHVVNLWANDPLVGYHSRSASVVAPLGADLPGIYGRVLSLCSGRAPIELPSNRLLQYPAVPRDVADALFDRLTK